MISRETRWSVPPPVVERSLAARRSAQEPVGPEVSVVMPCLNEAETVGACIDKAASTMREHGIEGEVIVADNGSSDGSKAIARRMGAVVVDVESRGYGNAMMGGIAMARGRFIIMGDADGSYDFGAIPQFVAKLREGFDLVQGCRLPSGGGTVLPGAMPWLHRWWGNPMFSMLARRMFRTHVHDVYCGLRGFSKKFYERLDQRCAGMEFATEMIIKASLFGGRVAEVPITLHPDGRTAHLPHLKTFRDGWRTIRLLLICSPRWLFLAPGGLLIALGLIGYALAMPGLTVGRVTFSAHTLLFSSMAILCGYQAILFAVFSTMFGISEGLLPPNPRLERWFEIVTLERALILAVAALLCGAILLIGAVLQWSAVGFGVLRYGRTMRWVIPGVTFGVLGFQTILSSFFISILGMRRRPSPTVI
jgi:glycosyltransferase involved in cell wall biosynthesis